MTLKDRFLDAIRARTQFAPAVRLLLEHHFGEVMFKVPETGGPTEAFFRFPVMVARELIQGEYVMQETFGKGRTKEGAIIDLFDRHAVGVMDGLVLRYDGEHPGSSQKWDYKAFAHHNGDFTYLGIWVGDRRPSRIHSVDQLISLQAVARPR